MESSSNGVWGGPVGPVCILQGVQSVWHAALNVGQHHSLKTLCDGLSECYWPVVVQTGRGALLGKGNDGWGFEAGWDKMAPRMAAVLRAPGKLSSFSYVLFVFLLFYVLDVVSITVYDRDTLLNIGSSVAQRKPDFEFLNAGGLFTDTASEPFIWVAQLRKRRRRRKRGKRAGVLVRLRRRAFRHPLPTILLANVQSLDNKLCELRARISYQRETRDCCVICLTETWMSAMVPDSAIELTGFSVHRSDRTKALTVESRGGGVCFYINNLWCDERNY